MCWAQNVIVNMLSLLQTKSDETSSKNVDKFLRFHTIYIDSASVNNDSKYAALKRQMKFYGADVRDEVGKLEPGDYVLTDNRDQCIVS